MRRAVAAVLLAGVALLLGSAPAWAHSRLVSSDPADGASLGTAPASVSLVFNETVQAGFTTVTVIGPDGADYAGGAPAEVDRTVTAPVRPLGPAGTYRIGYRVVSADGHPISGEVAFTLTAAGPATSAAAQPAPAPPAGPAAVAPTAAATADGGMPVWPWIVGAVVLVAGGVAAALRLGR